MKKSIIILNLLLLISTLCLGQQRGIKKENFEKNESQIKSFLQSEFAKKDQVNDLKSQLNKELTELKKSLSDNQKELNQLQEDLDQLRMLIFAGLIVLLLLIILTIALVKKLTSRERIIKYVLDSKQIEDKFSVKNNSIPFNQSQEIKRLINDTIYSKKYINFIFDMIHHRSEDYFQSNEIENKKNYDIPKNVRYESVIPSYKYLKGKNGRFFSRAESNPDNSFFRIIEERDDYALFEFFGNEAEAIANRIFTDDICRIVSGGYQNSTRVTTNKPGKIKRTGDQWEVVQPVEIKLI